jgi:hypothetical protein
MKFLRVIVTVPPEQDLSWYLNESKAAAGVHSSWGPLTDAAQGGFGGGRNDPHAGRTRAFRAKDGDWKHPWLDAVGKERELHRRFGELSDEHQATLYTAYHRVGLPKETDRALGDLLHTVKLTAAFREVYDERGTPTEWLVGLCEGRIAPVVDGRRDNAKLLEAMRLQAVALIDVALRAWRASRPGRRQAEEVDDETTKRAALAARPVDGPRMKEVPRTWVPTDDVRPPRRDGAGAVEDWLGPGLPNPVGPCRGALLHTHEPALVVGRSTRRWDGPPRIQEAGCLPRLAPRGWVEQRGPKGARVNRCGETACEVGVWCEVGEPVEAASCGVDEAAA